MTPGEAIATVLWKVQSALPSASGAIATGLFLETTGIGCPDCRCALECPSIECPAAQCLCNITCGDSHRPSPHSCWVFGTVVGTLCLLLGLLCGSLCGFACASGAHRWLPSGRVSREGSQESSHLQQDLQQESGRVSRAAPYTPVRDVQKPALLPLELSRSGTSSPLVSSLSEPFGGEPPVWKPRRKS